MARLLLAGYFGCGNLGDDAVLLGLVQGLGDRHELTVLSGAPEETYRLYGMPSVPRKDMGAVNTALANSDALVFPGGSIFQDATSVKSVLYYHTLVKKAKALGKRVVLLGQGVGPLGSFFGKSWTAGSYNLADAITLRDPDSMQLLKNIGVKKPMRVAADTAFLLPPPPDAAEGSTEFKVGLMRAVGVCPRPHGNNKASVQLIGEVCRLLFQANYMPVLVEMDRSMDGSLIQEISKSAGGKIPDMRKISTPMQCQGRLARMDSVIAMRLHAGILAATVGVPPLMLAYDPKVSAFAKTLEIGNALPMDGLTAARVFESFQQMQRDREGNVRLLERKVAEQRELARLSLEALESALGTRAGA